MATTFRDFEDFWPYYVSQHRNPTCRLLHLTGTAIGLSLAAMSPLLPPLFVAAPVVGYGCSWIGHFFFERNKPATFEHPWWSLRGDFRMFRRMIQGQMGPEVTRSAQRYP